MTDREKKKNLRRKQRKKRQFVLVIAASLFAVFLIIMVTLVLLTGKKEKVPDEENSGTVVEEYSTDLIAGIGAAAMTDRMEMDFAGADEPGSVPDAAVGTVVQMAAPRTDTEPVRIRPGETVSENQAVDKAAEENVYDEKVETLLQEMTLHEKVCQMIVVTPEALTGVNVATAAGAMTQQGLQSMPVGGICFLAQNLETPEQTRTMIANMQSFAKEDHGIGLLITLDEEGGKVARVAGKLGTTQFSPMYEYRNDGVETARQNAKTIAADIYSMGVNLDLAPVADVWTNRENTVIGKRAYSDDPEQAAELVAAAVGGFHEGGVMCTLKHFPGHGDTKEDSHTGTAYSYKTLEELRQTEFLPFISGIDAGADIVMSSHVTMPQVDPTRLPTTLSPVILSILRDELGFQGVIMTDSLSMKALTDHYGYAKIGVMAVQAGNDILLCQLGMREMVAAIEEAVIKGEITEERIDQSVGRILALKLKYGLIE
ncbi:MAG: glycoside hydrolase family 3 [Lachnospiraceae bacterium]|nr:glycoside hydrolase family 3 [Lachnospiraceae bacterium]